MYVLEVHALRKTYESTEGDVAPVRALRGVDMTVEAREFVAIMGPSGCGKSTLLNMVAGLDTPSEGDITVAGESLAGKNEDDLARMRRSHIGIVFQFFNLLEGMSVLDNVTLPAVVAGASRKQAESRARDLDPRFPVRLPDPRAHQHNVTDGLALRAPGAEGFG